MVQNPTLACIGRRLQNLFRRALHSSAPRLRSAFDERKGRALIRSQGPSQWSELEAAQEFASAFDRALLAGKDARVRVYTIRLPGQTGMCSSSALWYLELAAGRGVHQWLLEALIDVCEGQTSTDVSLEVLRERSKLKPGPMGCALSDLRTRGIVARDRRPDGTWVTALLAPQLAAGQGGKYER